VPLPVEHDSEIVVAAFGRDVGRTGRQIHRPHRVALGRGRLAHRHPVGEVDRFAVVAANRAPAARRHEVLGQVEVAFLAGLAIQLHQRHFDDRVAVETGVLLRAERCDEVVGGPHGDAP
jgi:hypothetical protein